MAYAPTQVRCRC